MPLAEEQMLRMYRQMLAIRSFERRARELWKAGLISGSIHTCVGQEAIAVGVCAALRPTDYVATTHRGHGHCIAKGGDLGRMMAELMGREAGYCRGKGGSMHIADLDIGILGASGIVAGGIPMAVGAGFSARVRGTDQVSVSFFGDGATNQGSWHESVNLASVWKLPVLFVCENNQYAISTHISTTARVKDLADRAAAYGIPGIVLDGMDPTAVYEAVAPAVERARRGEGPTLMECKTYRFEGHFVADDGSYRPREEVEAWRARDPIPAFRRRLGEMGVLDGGRAGEIEALVERELAEAIEFAKAAPEPAPESLFEGLYA